MTALKNTTEHCLPKSSLLVYGPCSNAGDMLIYKAFQSLFAEELSLRYQHIRLDKLDSTEKAIIIGPGGILSGSYNPEKTPHEWLIRHLNKNKVDLWSKENKKVFFFGTGTNTPFNANKNNKPFSAVSGKAISDLISLSDGVYLRGNYDIIRIQNMCSSLDIHKLKFQPCPSMFIDKMCNNILPKSDKIAVNFPLLKQVTSENYKTHPLRRFIHYAKSCGLDVEFSPNHTMDINHHVIDMFDTVALSKKTIDFMLSKQSEDYNLAQEVMQQEWDSTECIFQRHSGYRFAFGSRLHSFLPFMAFNTPSLFMTGNVARMPIPMDYFQDPIFLARSPYNVKALDIMVDGMIERLDFFIKHEDRLISNIEQHKERLWGITQKNKTEMLSKIQ